jgi:hypothetical protein
MAEHNGPKRIPIDNLPWELHTNNGDLKRQTLESLSETPSADFLNFAKRCDIWPIGPGGSEKGVVEGIAKDYLATLKSVNGANFQDWQAPLASVIYWHGLHVGVEHEILWNSTGPGLDWTANAVGAGNQILGLSFGGTGRGAQFRAVFVLTDGWLFYTINAVVMVFPLRSIPTQPILQQGLAMGKVLIPHTSDCLSGAGIDWVPNPSAKELPDLWAFALAMSLQLYSEDGLSDSAYSFLPQEETFICDGQDCGVIAQTEDALAKRKKVVKKVFAGAGVEIESTVAPSVMSAWHAVVIKAAAESEINGAPVAVLASHAQLALGITGKEAKSLVKAARERGLLELPRDVHERFEDPSGSNVAQDLPFPIEGFGRLCADCLEDFRK